MSALPESMLPSPYMPLVPPEVRAENGAWTYGIAAWLTANRAIYSPFSLPSTQRVKSITIYCGATGSGNYDIGIYDATGLNRIISRGSTALTTGKVVWTPAVPLLLEAGRRYFLGLVCSTTSATLLRGNANLLSNRAGGYSEQSTALPLPNPAVPVVRTSGGYIPMFVFDFVL